ncbi:HlyD family secretion protein [Enterococcus sp. DIV2402]|uniref:HlyD family secretion protein n=1 Tax=Candidatus Enterococcus lowellii TaxID=2230877 RepID=A0ABZ2SR53_9ENTE|nr:efflux RND transporter periplasmic adaptor subunit [Enterococcus sp. DIV2402]MBO0463621.1 efflux RND transporter periplasmic adaptor subunit [Enterococcus sp. DIV2402]
MKKEKRKKLSKKKQIIVSIAAAIVAILVIVMAYIYSRPTQAKEDSYQVVTLAKANPLIFKGVVTPATTEAFYYDQSKGDISDILVQNGQEIKANTAVMAYENKAVQEQIDEQEQSLEKLNFSIQTAQQNLDNAYVKKQEIQDKLYTASTQFDNADNSTPEGQAIRQEEQVKKEQYTEALSAQDDVILQAQQALDSAYLDANSANESIESTQNKMITNVFAKGDGIVTIDMKGEANPAVPLIQVISKETVVEAKVTEYDYNRLQKDTPITIQLTNDNTKIDGTITKINPLPDSSEATQTSIATYTFTVKPAENIQYGYNCQIILPIDELRIPESALVTDEEQVSVFVVKHGKAHKTPVSIEKKDSFVVVKKGLSEKEKIIENPDNKLSDGQEVTVK